MSVNASIQNITGVETQDLGGHGGVLRFLDDNGNTANIFMPFATATTLATVYRGMAADKAIPTEASS